MDEIANDPTANGRPTMIALTCDNHLWVRRRPEFPTSTHGHNPTENGADVAPGATSAPNFGFGGCSDGVGTSLARSDADQIVDVGDPDLAVADLAGAGRP